MVLKPKIFLCSLLLLCAVQLGIAQDEVPEGPCDLAVTTSLAESGDVTLCYTASYTIGMLSLSCNAEAGYLGQYEGGRQSCLTVSCCPDVPLSLSWSYYGRPCHTAVATHCCTGTDSDGDGRCDDDDCTPDDPSTNYGSGDACDDGNPNTFGDHYDDNCNCVGYPDEGCLTGPDTDGDGICDDSECNPNDPAQTHVVGDYCNDGDPGTYNDRYNNNCECIGEPMPCGDVSPDDGCHLTVDVINADCTVENIPPNPDDGCEYTYDYFDEIQCLIINEPLPCDDGNPLTKNDRLRDGCVCKGDPECYPEPDIKDRRGHCHGVVCDIEIGEGTNFRLTSNIGASLVGMNVCVIGDLYVDEDFDFINCQVEIDPDANIFVLRSSLPFGFNLKTLTINNSDLFTCEGMWNGISVSTRATIITENESSISNARRAIHAFGVSALLNITSTTFSNNDIGILLTRQPFNRPPVLEALANNIFTDGDTGIRTSGVNILNAQNLNGPGTLLTNSDNRFTDLRVGISAVQRTSIALLTTTFERTTQHCVNQNEGDLNLDGVNMTDCSFRGINSLIAHNFTIRRLVLRENIGNLDAVRIDGFAPGADVNVLNSSFIVTETPFEVNGIHLIGGIVGGGTSIVISANNFDMSRTGRTPYANTNGGAIPEFGDKPAAINLSGMFPSSSQTHIHSNTRISCFGDMYAINAGNGDKNNLNIYNNTLGELVVGGNGIAPIRVVDSAGSNNRIDDNSIFSFFNSDHTSFLISSNFQGTTYCSNSITLAPSSAFNSSTGVQRFSQGFFFTGNNENTDFVLNEFESTAPGLLISNGVIGPQEFKGNMWSDHPFFATTNPRAWLLPGNFNDRERNKFIVSEPNPSILFPRVAPAIDWFEFSSLGSPAFGCLVQLQEPVQPIDLLIAEPDFNGYGFGAADKWNAERYLYSKLENSPHLRLENDLLAQWTPSGNIPKFESAEKLIFDTESDAMVMQIQNSVKLKLEEFKNTDLNQLSELRLEIDSLHSVLADMIELSAMEQENRYSQALVILSSLQPNNEIEELTKEVLLLYLDKKVNNDPFTSEEVILLTSVAEDCVSRIGFIVNVAKELLPTCTVYQNCEYIPEYSQDNQSLEFREREVELGLFPNPVINKLDIEYDMDQANALYITDATGSIVMNQSGELGNSIELNLESGIYVLTIHNKDNTIVSKTFVVVD